MSRHDHVLTREWVGAGTDLFVSQLHTDLSRPSRLPGWTRAHVVGHVARNAAALTRLARWARTGVETPMYADPGQRSAEIEQSAALPAAKLRLDVQDTAAELEHALDSVAAGEAWSAEVRSAKGRLIPAAEIPWLRVREVWLHAIDLDTGVEFEHLPGDLVDCLLDDVSASYAGRGPALLLRAVDRKHDWKIPGDDPVLVEGAAADLLAWLTGRSLGEESGISSTRGLPELPAWL